MAGAGGPIRRILHYFGLLTITRSIGPGTVEALARSVAAIARLDYAIAGHLLAPTLLYSASRRRAPPSRR